jgi:hypothetical protein
MKNYLSESDLRKAQGIAVRDKVPIETAVQRVMTEVPAGGERKIERGMLREGDLAAVQRLARQKGISLDEATRQLTS